MSMRVFVDMDGVIADFDALSRELCLTGEQLKSYPLAFKRMQPIPGAIEAVRSVIGMGYEVWIASKPATGRAQTYADKVEWILCHLPELKRNIVLTHDKGMLGDEEDFLVDDRPHKANCRAFRGTLIEFTNGVGWPQVLRILKGKASTDISALAECGAGWAQLYMPLVARVRGEGGRVLQIKEKFGGMRFYVDHNVILTQELIEDIRRAEAMSYGLCEQCGAPGARMSAGGWIKTLCMDHFVEFAHMQGGVMGT